MATEALPNLNTPVPAWRRPLVAIGWFALLVVGVCAAVYLFNRHRLVSQLDRTRAELDESDPGWRWPAPFQVRHDIPPEENCAERALSIIRDIPRRWPDPVAWEKLQDLQPNMILDAPRREMLDGVMATEPVPRLRAEARGLVKYPRGRIEPTLADNPLLIPVSDQQKMSEAAILLHFDANDLDLKGQHSEALKAARACLTLSRALEDDPLLACQKIRIAIAAMAMKMAERTMALGDAPDDALAELQKHMEHEAGGTRLTVAMRGARASTDRIVLLLASGEVTLHEVEGLSRTGGRLEHPWGPGWLLPLTGREMARREHGDVLRMMTKVVEASKLPVKDQLAVEDDIEGQLKSPSSGTVMRLLVPGIHEFSGAARRVHAQAVAMRALVAVERYRLRHGKWPATLEDAVPAFLDKVPPDPIDGKPVRYKRRADGVVVYSIGNDRVDNGGEVAGKQRDFGHRLWNPDKRRAPPP